MIGRYWRSMILAKNAMPHLQSQMIASISGPRKLFILLGERRKNSARSSRRTENSGGNKKSYEDCKLSASKGGKSVAVTALYKGVVYSFFLQSQAMFFTAGS